MAIENTAGRNDLAETISLTKIVTGKIHHAIAGKIHVISTGPCSSSQIVSHYQKVYRPSPDISDMIHRLSVEYPYTNHLLTIFHGHFPWLSGGQQHPRNPPFTAGHSPWIAAWGPLGVAKDQRNNATRGPSCPQHAIGNCQMNRRILNLPPNNVL